MKRDLYLLWDGKNWGVYDGLTMPDPAGVFPDYAYRKYKIPNRKVREIFKRLIEIKNKLETSKIIPAKETQLKIFPGLENLLK